MENERPEINQVVLITPEYVRRLGIPVIRERVGLPQELLATLGWYDGSAIPGTFSCNLLGTKALDLPVSNEAASVLQVIAFLVSMIEKAFEASGMVDGFRYAYNGHFYTIFRADLVLLGIIDERGGIDESAAPSHGLNRNGETGGAGNAIDSVQDQAMSFAFRIVVPYNNTQEGLGYMSKTVFDSLEIVAIHFSEEPVLLDGASKLDIYVLAKNTGTSMYIKNGRIYVNNGEQEIEVTEENFNRFLKICMLFPNTQGYCLDAEAHNTNVNAHLSPD